ncbi:MAG: YifB family Mg chelatase-like AAA ATPase [Planctomycetota bacterium]|nr:YifB family Mg chelatase-like AAA ATPase [Planctomycetota bacterium]
MLASLQTFSLLGIDAIPVDVEVDVATGGLPKTILVGLPEAAVRESTHRVERSLVNSGFQRPQHRVVINLAPAELPKQAASFDLPISLGFLASSGQLSTARFADYAAVGELSLQGQTRPVKGALAMAMSAAREPGLKGIVVPAESAPEAAVVQSLEVVPVASLHEAVAFFAGAEVPCSQIAAPSLPAFQPGSASTDFADVSGQEMVKRAIMLAAAGAHNLLMIGPPGSGKTMLAKRIPSILPPLSNSESLETTRIYSALGRLGGARQLVTVRPFRAPHHTISDAGLVGGGSTPVPGEISMSHNGVLFLDELPEFQRRTLESMRQPLEEKTVTISRALQSTTFPADFMLIAAMNPCPCGFRGHPRRDCQCSTPQIDRYLSKISGPLLDRIDIQIEVAALSFDELTSQAKGTSSREMRTVVAAAREIQRDRFGAEQGQHNAHMNACQLRKYCQLDPTARQLLRVAVNQLGLSARAYDKILRVARTIADLAGASGIQTEHVSEAIQYRILDRQPW